jgi:hypothetical protein
MDPRNQLTSLAAFGIDPDRYKWGWETARDIVYDALAESLRRAAALLQTVNPIN